jgi:ABC-2 type transport system permease protein
MKKYWQITKTSWSNGFVYRLNFIMWRVRTIIWFFTIYYFWVAILSQNDQVFNYDSQTLLTYVIGTSFLRSLVLSSRSVSAGMEIANGDLNNYLVKPINYLKNWLARDIADKALNLAFFIPEMVIIFLVIKPPFIFPNNPWYFVAFIVAALIATLMYFFFSFLVSCFTFWYPEHNGWPLRFIVFMIIGFLAGDTFPLDIFPAVAQTIFKILPFGYFMFYPMQIYLGRIPANQVGLTIIIMLAWVFILYKISTAVFKKGLKVYGAYGR